MSLPEVYSDIDNYNPDIALIMLGSFDKVYRSIDNEAIIGEIQDIINNLNSDAIFVTTDLVNISLEGEGLVENFNQHLLLSPPTGIDDLIDLPEVETYYDNLTNSEGYDIIADKIWLSFESYLNSLP